MVDSLTRLLKAAEGSEELLNRLLMVAEPGPDQTMCGPDDAHAIMAPLVAGYPEEHFAVAALDSRKRVIAAEVLTIGSAAHTVVDPRQVFRWALLQGKSGAAAIIIAHNHPSGDPTPSVSDRQVTRRVAAAGRTLGIELLDHIVVGSGGNYASLAEEGECG